MGTPEAWGAPWPQGTPLTYQRLAEACMATSPAARPSFERIQCSLRQMRDDLETGGPTACELSGCYEPASSNLREHSTP